MDSYQRLLRLSTVVAPQRSPDWYTQRFHAANSSQYETMFNANNMRTRQLISAVNNAIGKTNLAMTWGTTMEECSGYVFTATTNLEYKEIGSIGHPENQRIRGSVDGYGLDGEKKLFVLETKTPFTRVPGPKLQSRGYYCQVVQNIEIVNASYGLFNDVRLLPCTTDLALDESAAYDISTEDIVECSFSRYNVASTLPKPINLISVAVYPSEDSSNDSESSTHVEGDRWFGNLFDAFSGQNPHLTLGQLKKVITKLDYKWCPMNHTVERGEEAREWIELEHDKISSMKDTVGYALLKLDAHNIERIERNHNYWQFSLRPIAERWLDDLDAVRLNPSVVLSEEVHHIPDPTITA